MTGSFEQSLADLKRKFPSDVVISIGEEKENLGSKRLYLSTKLFVAACDKDGSLLFTFNDVFRAGLKRRFLSENSLPYVKSVSNLT